MVPLDGMTVLPSLAQADGVFFLTLGKGDRVSIKATIERLIDMLDAMEPDPDLEDAGDLEDTGDYEPTLGAVAAGYSQSQTLWAIGGHGEWDECEEENEHGGDVLDEPHDSEDDSEPFLGWTEHQSINGGVGIEANEAIGIGGGNWTGDGYRVGNDLLRTLRCRIGEPVSHVRVAPALGWRLRP